MRRILKYPIHNPVGSSHLIPFHAPLRLVDVQEAIPTLWFEVEDGTPAPLRTFGFVGTGHEIPWALGDCTHLGSAYEPSSGLVWHVYELKVPTSG